jgi:hypothetical protein
MSSVGGASSAEAESRFSALLLEYGEYYFEDFTAVCHLNYPNGVDHRQQWKGWLRVCSKSIVFDPIKTDDPIIRFKLQNVSDVAILCSNRHVPNDSAKFAAQMFQNTNQSHRLVALEQLDMVESVVIQASECFLIQKKQPFVCVEFASAASVLVSSIKSGLVAFSFPYTKASKVCELVSQLHQIARTQALGGKSRQTAMVKLKQFVTKVQQATSFNSSWLADFRERPRLKAPIIASKVSPLLKTPGWLQITESRIYFQPVTSFSLEPVMRFEIKLVRGAFARRHTLRDVGLEVYFKKRDDSDGGKSMSLYASAESTLFLTFDTKAIRDEVLEILLSLGGDNVVSSSPGEIREMQIRWARGEISNFDYLMFLNEQAGRSFNDLTQYPVFPWVIADYKSSQLDFSKKSTFRDLSKPIGALNPDRLKNLRNRMKEMAGTDPRMQFLYGTHYSTPAYVLFFLVRLYPEYMLCLQNGRFDEPDRLFNSIVETWQSCLNNPADVKELIPQFYGYCDARFKSGDFLKNLQELNLGIRQSGMYVDNVELPPWASSPEEFVKTCREALESDYVSKNLNLWIDLVFGYKNSGELALKADNLFYYLTYEGAVDIDAMQDLEEKQSIESQINEFGQTPRQLFSRAHPPRSVKGVLLEEKSDFEVESKSSSGSLALPATKHHKDYFNKHFKLQFPSLDVLSEIQCAESETKSNKFMEAFDELAQLNLELKLFAETSTTLSIQLEEQQEKTLQGIEDQLEGVQDEIDRCSRELQRLVDERSASKIVVDLSLQNVSNLSVQEQELLESKNHLAEELNFKIEQMRQENLLPLFPLRSGEFLESAPDVFTRMCGFLKIAEIACLEAVCKTWRRAIHGSKAWHFHLKKRGRMYEVEDDSKWFHEHFLFEMKIDDEKSCLISVEESPIPNSMSECRNVMLRDMMQRDPVLKKQLESKARAGLMEVCRRNPGKWDLEAQFCVKALKLHKRYKRFEISINKMEKKLNDLLSEKTVTQREVTEHEPIIQEILKQLDLLKLQFASDEHTRMFLQLQQETFSQQTRLNSSEISSLEHSHSRYLEEKSKILEEITSKKEQLYQTLDSSRFELKKQVVLLSSELRNLQSEFELLQREESTFNDHVKLIQGILQNVDFAS